MPTVSEASGAGAKPITRVAGQKSARRLPSFKSALRLAIVVAGAAALVIAVRVFPAERYLLDLVAWMRGAGWLGVIAYVIAYVAACVLFLPGAVLTLGAGFAYGVLVGVPIVWVGANLGATLAFVLGRTLLRGWVAAKVQSRPGFAAIDRAVGRQGLRIVLLTRLSPVFPFNLLNYAFGLTQVTLRDYLVGSMIGMTPGSVMYVYLGSLITNLTELAAGRTSGGNAQQIFYFGGLAATVIVTLYVTRLARGALAAATGDAPAAQRAATAAAALGAPKPTAEPAPLVLPDDQHNRLLLSRIRPAGRVNPTPAGRYNLVVIGGGTAGLVSAAGGAGLGARVALIERHLLGGDCLNVGCVPSKGLISAAQVAAQARVAGAFGVRVAGVEVDFGAVMERMRRLRAQLSVTDSVERLTSLGVDVYLGEGRFVGPDSVEVDGRLLRFSKAVITTGARAAAPNIAGLAQAGYLTNENLFWLTELPRRLVVIGAGPIGCEMAQTFNRLGSQVTLLEAETHILPREDLDAALIVEERMRAEGVNLVCCTNITQVERRGAEAIVRYRDESGEHVASGDQVLIGVGRAANVEGLGLEAAGVAYDRNGVKVNDRLQTSNRRIYAAGDVASRYKFTHMADALARIVLANTLFMGRRKASALHVPWCTYTSPAIAHVGLYEREAAERGIAIQTITAPLGEVDRAVLEGQDQGFLRVHLKKGSDRILGATLVAEHAGDMLSELTLAMASGVGLGAIANVVHPYPTQAEVIRKAADVYNRSRLTPTVRKLFNWWMAARR